MKYKYGIVQIAVDTKTHAEAKLDPEMIVIRMCECARNSTKLLNCHEGNKGNFVPNPPFGKY